MRGFIICGQDLILDVLSNFMRLHGVMALRAYIGSYDSLVSLYHGRVNVATAHLWDAAGDDYNVPYVRALLPGIRSVIVNITYRMQGLYVSHGNPKNIRSWRDFGREDLTMINREKGAGSRVLLDENLKLLGLHGSRIPGYDNENQSHLAVASAVGRGDADVAVGNEEDCPSGGKRGLHSIEEGTLRPSREAGTNRHAGGGDNAQDPAFGKVSERVQEHRRIRCARYRESYGRDVNESRRPIRRP